MTTAREQTIARMVERYRDKGDMFWRAALDAAAAGDEDRSARLFRMCAIADANISRLTARMQAESDGIASILAMGA